MKTKVRILALTLSLMSLLSCNKENQAPVMPPKESMAMDFKAFKGGEFKSSQLKSIMMTDSTKADSMSNYYYAKDAVDFWNFIVFITLSVPVSSYFAALSHEPVELSKGVWQWKYDYQTMGATYSCRLMAIDNSDHYAWEMYISKKGIDPFDEVKWFEGNTTKSGGSGDWTLYENPKNPVKLMKIDWSKNTSGKVSNIKYTYIKEKDDYGKTDFFYNSYIESGTTTGLLDHYFTIYTYYWWSGKMTTVNIEWSQETYQGQVKSPLKYGDNNWHAWDINGYNTVN